MFASEKKSFVRFLLIYTLSTSILVGIGEYLYYQKAVYTIMDRLHNDLQKAKKELIQQLKSIHQSFEPTIKIPHIVYDYAIYDIDKNFLFGTVKPAISITPGFYKSDRIYLIDTIKPHYAGAAYLILSAKIPKKALLKLQKELIGFSIFALMLITLTAFFLGRLFLAPIRRSLHLLDNFIKDATHELNTPISVIITNIELLEELHPKCHTEEIKHIEQAAMKLFKIFKDLAYLHLHHKRSKEIQMVALDELLRDRIRYFLPLAKNKGLTFDTKIAPVLLRGDKGDFETIIDNLLSNAIKYSYPHTAIKVELDTQKLIIEDEGVGIAKEKLDQITQKFYRANTKEGGFGLGLYIVAKLCKEYGMEIKIDSKSKKGTKVTIWWKK